MAQIHALLVISPEPLTTDDIIAELDISRGNVSMSLKSLMDWGIVEKAYMPGERKEYFQAEKDVWKMSVQVAEERRRRELIPVVKMLSDFEKLQLDEKNAKHKEFKKTTGELHNYAKIANTFLSKFSQSESGWFVKNVLKLFK